MSTSSGNFLFFNLLLILSMTSPVRFMEALSQPASPVGVDPLMIRIAPGLATSPTPEPALAKTEIVRLPLVEKSLSEHSLHAVLAVQALQESPVPDAPTPTITPTPLPPQTGLTNLPIVLGAAAIVIVIFIAWLLIGLRPRNRTS